MAVLYRKYRPQKFADVVGQPHIVQALQNAVKAGSVGHAYLFTGSRGVGKTSVARILAKAVNCLNSEKAKGDACMTCEICLAVTDGSLMDLVEIDAASNTGVDNVRELIEHVKFSPSRAKYKVFIIDEVHMLSKQAFNALLKTLEEPPAHAIFILATTDIEKVPETIISRTQRFDFRRITEADIVALLEKVVKAEKLKIDTEILGLIAMRAQGGLRDALSLLDKLSSLGDGISVAEAQSMLGLTSVKLSQNLIDAVLTGRAADLPVMFDELIQSGVDFLAFNRDVLEYMRKLLVWKIAGSGTATKNTTSVVLDLLPADLDILKQQADSASPAELMHMTRLFLRSYKELAGAPTPDLPLLLAAIEGALKGAGVQSAQSSQSTQPAQSSQSTRSTPAAFISKSVQEIPSANTASETISEIIIVEAPAAVVPDIIESDEPHSADEITVEEIKIAWPSIVEKVRAVNSPLGTLVKNSPIQSAGRGSVTIAVKYLFHKEHIESKKHYSLLVSSIQEATGKNIRLIVNIVKESDEVQLVQGLDAISDALKVFGGELVE